MNGEMIQNAGKDGRYKFRKAKKEHFSVSNLLLHLLNGIID